MVPDHRLRLAHPSISISIFKQRWLHFLQQPCIVNRSGSLVKCFEANCFGFRTPASLPEPVNAGRKGMLNVVGTVDSINPQLRRFFQGFTPL